MAPGVEFVDRELGVGIVRKLTDEGIVVAFGDAEKLIPRKKREGGYKKDGFKKDGHRKDFKKEAFSAAKPMEKKVFTFDAPLPDAKPTGFKKREAAVGLEVTDETLGKGTITRITERGTYVTYDATGERILYPMGLPSKLLKTAFPEVKKETKKRSAEGASAHLYRAGSRETGSEAEGGSPSGQGNASRQYPLYRDRCRHARCLLCVWTGRHHRHCGWQTRRRLWKYGAVLLLSESLRGRPDRSGGRLVAEEKISCSVCKTKKGAVKK